MLVQTKNPHYVRDTRSRALLPNDVKIVDDYKRRKMTYDEQKAMKEEINTLKEQMVNLDNKLDEIKLILIEAIK